MEQINKFRHPITNIRLTRSLFYEAIADKSLCIYTLKDIDYKGYKSFYKEYMRIADPTEYRVAKELLDGYEHWEMLCATSWFKQYVDKWRKELQVKIKSEALHKIMQEAKTNPKEMVNANKYILEKGWEQSTKNNENINKREVGRPSQDKIRKEAIDLFNREEEIQRDLQRLGEVLN